MQENKLDLKNWKSGRHEKPGRWPDDPELLHSVTQAKRFRLCELCKKARGVCPVCAGVI